MISTVTGHFRQFNVDAETASDDFASASNVKFTADIDSITTSNEQRDGHLKSADFFDAEKYPQLKFEGSRYDRSEEHTSELQSLMRISYAVFCLTKKKHTTQSIKKKQNDKN